MQSFNWSVCNPNDILFHLIIGVEFIGLDLGGKRTFRNSFDAVAMGIAIETLEGQPLFANPALCSMLGFSEDELRGKHCVEFSPPEDANKDRALFEQLRRGSIDNYHLEKRFFRKDGTLIWGRLSVALLKN